MKKLNFFRECKSIDEVKAEYKRCVQRWLPREGHAGDSDQLSRAENEYLEISKRPKFQEQSEEVKEEYLGYPAKVKTLVKLGLDLEMCGSWLWVGGNTIDHKEQLKELGLRYSPNKKMWYYRPKWSRSANSTPVDMEFIRKKYGSDADNGIFAFDRQYSSSNTTKSGEEVMV